MRGIIAELRTHKGSQAAAHAIIGILEFSLRKSGATTNEHVRKSLDTLDNWGQLRKDGLHILREIVQDECAGAVAALLEMGYTPADLDLAGFGGTSIDQLKDAGYSAAQMKDAGYSDCQLMWSGYSAAQMKDAGYSAAQLKRIGYSIDQVMDAGCSAAQMRDAGYSAAQLKNNGYSIDQVMDAGYSAVQMEGAYSIDQLTDAGYIMQKVHNGREWRRKPIMEGQEGAYRGGGCRLQ